MKLQTFTEPAEFLKRAQPFMEEHETVNNLILGVTLRLKERPDWIDTEPYLATVQRKNEELILVAAITMPHNLLLAGSPGADSTAVEAGLEALAVNLHTGGWPVPGAVAESDLARRFAQAWARKTGRSFQVDVNERIYELRQVIPLPHPPGGRLRRATIDDFEMVLSWYTAFNTEIFGSMDLGIARKAVSQRISNGDTFLWNNGGPVSMAVRTRPTAHGESVGSVYTPPEMRGRGYASACVAAVSQLILDSGKQFCNLFTDLSNPTSNSIYQKIGYRPVCDFTMYSFSQ